MLENAKMGAKAQSAYRDNPRGILVRIMEENPSAPKSKLLAIVRDELLRENNIECLDAVIDNWFTREFTNITSSTPANCATRERDRAASISKAKSLKVKIAAQVQEKIRDKAKIMLMDMVLPTGKTLRKSTGRECAQAGGMFARIARKIGPDQMVGKILSERELQKMWNGR